MGEEVNHQVLLDLTLEKMHDISSEAQHHQSWLAMADDHDDNEDDLFESIRSSDESSMEESRNSAASSCSSELLDDASSSASSSSSASMLQHSNGPLYELSELMAQLPIKRGLSKYYQGKSQSYTSLASVKSVEDLAKKGNNIAAYRPKMKACKSYAWGLDGHISNKSYSPKATISKKAASSRGLLLSSLGKRSGSCCRVSIAHQKC